MRVIVSILSEQLIPNVLFIKQMSTGNDYYVFLTTDKMENDGKSEILSDTLRLPHENFKKYRIDANNPSEIYKKLRQIEWPEGERYIINITGGTKMMSQAVFIYFSKLQKTEIYYWPIGKTVMVQVHPEMKEIQISNPVSLDLKTYLRAHGYDFTSDSSLTKIYDTSDQLFNKVINNGAAEKVPEIAAAKEEFITHIEKVYYSGGWFEEWLYSFLKKELKLSNDQIALNLKLKNRFSRRASESDNEIDVALVYKNRLYIWECKVYNAKNFKGFKIANAIYKIASVSQSLGLQATSFVVILTPFGKSRKRKEFLSDITSVMRIKKVFSMEDMKSKNLFINKVKKMIGYE